MHVSLESVLDPHRPQYEVDKTRCVIGRSMECDIYEPSGFISQYHCELLIDGETVTLHDLGSRNGTFVNGHRVENECELHDGDRLVIAFVPYEVHIQPAKSVEFGGLWSRWSQILGPRSAHVI